MGWSEGKLGAVGADGSPACAVLPFEEWVTYDTLGLIQQLGLQPPG